MTIRAGKKTEGGKSLVQRALEKAAILRAAMEPENQAQPTVTE